ncbi:hypothetical protein EHW99_2043 [Erwinia amylovora]|uniref:Uncharacterized protein n=2 Tax=Erwinia amylovora TaxID=552 RepID=A0A831A116_ERWAM|nr:hypothetical protein EaACW_1546 [Erwinia amylovora ACW56400]QJQ54745.1 hypothetical protein EHX00_2043 [Erwinia amylovora]CBA20489.1 hypothetical protein predicted by Glimmer/Critica [Erwinia amylovora CFBP1430]CCO78391.1 hypothetical protein BN432_1588 [Erwinia amylovora Ea356]CCO85976.1 hypothetical protein BN434_1583 [Erwinia amylovora CFBP 2585]CCO89765.1 hypothetical protein BN435_1588 [Erwinia amylovora 01SFR-BO]CCO93516.1 hypothetical protein BN437_1581 [Erwinia amylovora NBRC 12687
MNKPVKIIPSPIPFVGIKNRATRSDALNFVLWKNFVMLRRANFMAKFLPFDLATFLKI